MTGAQKDQFLRGAANRCAGARGDAGGGVALEVGGAGGGGGGWWDTGWVGGEGEPGVCGAWEFGLVWGVVLGEGGGDVGGRTSRLVVWGAGGAGVGVLWGGPPVGPGGGPAPGPYPGPSTSRMFCI